METSKYRKLWPLYCLLSTKQEEHKWTRTKHTMQFEKTSCHADCFTKWLRVTSYNFGRSLGTSWPNIQRCQILGVNLALFSALARLYHFCMLCRTDKCKRLDLDIWRSNYWWAQRQNAHAFFASFSKKMQYLHSFCNLLHYFAFFCNFLQLFAIVCNILQYFAIFCNILEYFAICLALWREAFAPQRKGWSSAEKCSDAFSTPSSWAKRRVWMGGTPGGGGARYY